MSPEQKKRLSEATGALAVAQTEVEAALREVTVATRADKSIISQRLAVAFEKLGEARTQLEKLVGNKK